VSVVGIDLGTTNTVVGCVRAGKVHVLADEKGVRLLPSVVSFHPNGEVLVGSAAKARRVIDAKNTVYSHKRLIGRSWGSAEIGQARKRLAFELREGPGQGPLVHARGQEYTLPEISAFVLKRARQIAEQALGTPVERAVITVPAHFNELQRASTKVAGRVSGLEVLRILNEPTAAALAYGLGRTGNERVAVYDFGGGTFDCTLLDLNGNVFEVLATAGDSFLGGDDVDNLIADRMAEAFLKQHRQDATQDTQLYERLKTTAEDVKIALSTAETHTVMLKDFGHGSGGKTLDFQFTLTRRDLEAMLTPLVDRSFKVTQDALSLARLSPTSFDKVILVGGSTRMPLVRRRVEAFFGAPPMDRVNPDEVVAIGAAIQAAALTEGIRRRSIPAPPGVPRRQSQADTQETTQTSELDPSTLKPAFGSAPPGFGFAGGSQQPPSPSGLPNANNAPTDPSGIIGDFRTTKPGVGTIAPTTKRGVAPATQPMPVRTSPAAPQKQTSPATQANEEDPSIPSFPDLAAPTPFEWFPGSSGGPSTSPALDDPQTLTQAGPGGVRPDPAPSFGAIDEPSLMSTPSASIPSFPSLNTAKGVMPSPIGDDAPWRQQARPLPDLSGAASSANPGSNEFGHVSELSMITNPTMGDAITQARAHPFPGEAAGKGNTLQIEPSANPAAVPSSGPTLDREDLPSVAPRAKPARKEAPVGMGPSGGASMVGKPPPAAATRPFGPMEKVGGANPDSSSRLAAAAAPSQRTPGGKQPPAIVKKAIPNTLPQQARPNPLATTAPLGGQPNAPPPQRPPSEPFAVASPPHSQPRAFAPPAPAAPPPFAPEPRAPSAFPPFGGQDAQPAPPPQRAFASAPPPHPLPTQQSAYASAPPQGLPTQQSAYASAPPPLQSHFASQPPQQPPPQFAFGSAPPPPAPYASSPPMPAYGQQAPPPPPPPNVSGAPPEIQYQAPLLVDVTPRGLVVETAGGYTDTIIPRNSKIPCERTRRFATGRDMQTSVRVRVAQGESPAFHQNTFLGEVELSGLRPASRGEVTVAVTFEVDADGTLRVRARDVQTGHEARATLRLVGVADESSVVMMINRFAQQPITSGSGSS
jgi:molecular chaperone DnaK